MIKSCPIEVKTAREHSTKFYGFKYSIFVISTLVFFS